MAFLGGYPEATLQDIYKGCFQDFFGPAHAISDRESVRRYILAELERVSADSEPRIEPCGWRGEHYRVDLALVRSGRVDVDMLVDAFMAGAYAVDAERIDAWHREWALIQRVVRSVKPDLEGFERDSSALGQMLDEGRYAVHHSDKFNAAYKPHYRIVSREHIGKFLQ